MYALLSPSGKFYVGQTVNIRHRLYRHAYGNLYERSPIARAINKYGFHSFKKFILAINCSKEWRDFYESLFIGILNSHVRLGGYNCTYGGDGSEGYRHSEEVRKGISLRQLGTKQSPETIRKRSQSSLGKKCPWVTKESTRNGIKACEEYWRSQKGIPCTPARLAAARKACAASRLRPKSDKWKEAMAARTGKPASPALRAAMNKRIGIPRTVEQRAAIRTGHLARKIHFLIGRIN